MPSGKAHCIRSPQTLLAALDADGEGRGVRRDLQLQRDGAVLVRRAQRLALPGDLVVGHLALDRLAILDLSSTHELQLRPLCKSRQRVTSILLTIQKSKCKNIKCCGCECDRDPTLPDAKIEPEEIRP